MAILNMKKSGNKSKRKSESDKKIPSIAKQDILAEPIAKKKKYAKEITSEPKIEKSELVKINKKETVVNEEDTVATKNEKALSNFNIEIKKNKKRKKNKKLVPTEPTNVVSKDIVENTASVAPVKEPLETKEDVLQKYPILKDKPLIEKILSVKLTNNQKGRIRQAIMQQLDGIEKSILPDVVHSKIQAIMKNELQDAQYRKLRVLRNILKESLQPKNTSDNEPKQEKKKRKKKKNKKAKVTEEKKCENENKTDVTIGTESESENENKTVEKKNSENQKIKGPKRYVVFVGNLPPGVEKEKILEHFEDIREFIKDVRIPPRKEDSKSSIAYIELSNAASFELALSKHHSMFGHKRINVLYTAQKNGKVSTAEAKGKAAKLVALQKAGKLAGSVRLSQKRSQRRKKAKLFKAKENIET